MGYTDVLTTVTKFKKSCLPSQWNGLLTLLIKSLAERSGGSDGSSKDFLTLLYSLYNGINLDYGTIIWSQVVQSLNTSTRHSEISCGCFWTLITRRAINTLDIPVMKDALVASIATFHTKEIIISDPTNFHHKGSIPKSMYRCVSAESQVMAEYRTLPPKGPRVLTPEQQAALEAVDKPGNRGKCTTTKKDSTKEDKTKASKTQKRKSHKGDSSKPKKLKKMARRSKSPTPPGSENDKEYEEEEGHHESPRGNTPPRSPTPTEPIHEKIPTPPPSPKQTITVSVPIDPPPTTSQPTTSLTPAPPVTTILISTSPLPPLIISQSTTTTIPDPTVEVNVSDTRATTTTETSIITKPLSPTNSTDSDATLGGKNDEYDSTYFNPYQFPSDEDNDAPFNS
ncbi:hypothetical protein Lser_V15G02560 [Lactuca serriola]